jgi:hypothetical protein
MTSKFNFVEIIYSPALQVLIIGTILSQFACVNIYFLADVAIFPCRGVQPYLAEVPHVCAVAHPGGFGEICCFMYVGYQCLPLNLARSKHPLFYQQPGLKKCH